jgi:uncharacterized protein
MLQEKWQIMDGYASVFDIIDSHNDIITRGAFTNSLNNKENVKLLWQHDIESPIGICDYVAEDNFGLYVKVKILLDLESASDAKKLVENNIINGLSVGFQVIDYEYQGDIRIITEAELVEISLVTFPANKQSVIHKIY